jgi:hypothetical protein
MYGMVLMVAITGSGDSASFGKRGGCDGAGCTGVVASAGCSGCSGNSCHGGGFLGLRGRRHSCDGGCSGYSAGCTGVPAGCTGVVVAPVAPVVAPVAAPCAPACAPACDPCAKKRQGLFSRLCHKKKDCAPACAAPACSPCAGVVVVPPATTTPMTMPPVTGKKE